MSTRSWVSSQAVWSMRSSAPRTMARSSRRSSVQCPVVGHWSLVVGGFVAGGGADLRCRARWGGTTGCHRVSGRIWRREGQPEGFLGGSGAGRGSRRGFGADLARRWGFSRFIGNGPGRWMARSTAKPPRGGRRRSVQAAPSPTRRRNLRGLARSVGKPLPRGGPTPDPRRIPPAGALGRRASGAWGWAGAPRPSCGKTPGAVRWGSRPDRRRGRRGRGRPPGGTAAAPRGAGRRTRRSGGR